MYNLEAKTEMVIYWWMCCARLQTTRKSRTFNFAMITEFKTARSWPRWVITYESYSVENARSSQFRQFPLLLFDAFITSIPNMQQCTILLLL